jgi:alpha-ketoglutarate-dependent taurine dioxygenase
MNRSDIDSPPARGKWADRRKAITRTALSPQLGEMVKTGLLSAGKPLPLVIQPNFEGVDLSTWGAANREFLETKLNTHGALLFRGFGLRTQAEFEEFLNAISLNVMNYIEGATPRTKLSDKVYTSTEYPQDQSIALHNELTYVRTWPTRVCFFCVTPAEQGGETPIADVRRVFNRLRPQTVQGFMDKGWMLVRNFSDELSLPWRVSYHASSKAEVEQYCRASDIDCEWLDGDRLRTRQVRPAVAMHPVTGEMLWFNHVAFWHVSSLEPKVREAMLAVCKEAGLPYNTYYGDGSPIEPSVVEELRQAYQQETVAFLWQQGDLLLLDNMLVAHGRNPFTGPRKVLVAMGDPYSSRGL